MNPLSDLCLRFSFPQVRRREGDRTALYMFLVAIGAGIAVCMQNLLFSTAAASFTAKLRSLLFRAVLGQESLYLFFVSTSQLTIQPSMRSPVF
jgi:hypothetical protein